MRTREGCDGSVTFSASADLPIGVFSHGKHVGNIFAKYGSTGRCIGFHYQPKGGGQPGETFQTVQAVKRSLEVPALGQRQAD